MKNPLVIPLVLIATCGMTACEMPASTETSPTAVVSAADFEKQLDTAVEQAMKELNVPGAVVGISIPGKVNYAKAFGTSDKATGKAMTLEDQVRIGSVTKTFVGTAILQLVDQKKVQLSDPIAKYITGVPQGDKITLQMLGTMRSGIFPYTSDEEFANKFNTLSASGSYDGPPPFTPQELTAYGLKHSLNFEPDSSFEYSNTNTLLLGLVVEKVTGKKLDDYINQHILTRLKLTHSSMPATGNLPSPYAHGYTNQTPDQSFADATLWNPSWAWAAGAMISTFSDMKLWAAELGYGTLLKPETQKERLQSKETRGETSYGFAIFNDHGWIGHNGSLPGYTTVVVCLPEQNATLVVNATTEIASNGANGAGRIARAVTSIATPDHVYSIEGGK